MMPRSTNAGLQVKTAGQEDEEVDGEDVDKKSKVILISIELVYKDPDPFFKVWILFIL